MYVIVYFQNTMCIRPNFSYLKEIFHQHDDERNLVSATFHMVAITLLCMSLGDLTWFTIDGNVCVPYLTVGEFFWFGYSSSEISYDGKFLFLWKVSPTHIFFSYIKLQIIIVWTLLL